MFHTGIDGMTKTTLTKLAKYVTPVSVSGYRHAFITVGSAARQSPDAANTIAARGESAIVQKSKADSERTPHNTSQVVIFQ
jgi:hypothetical protein